MSPVEYFLKGIYITINSILSVHEQLVFKFLTCLVQEKIYMMFLLASLKTLTNFKSVEQLVFTFLTCLVQEKINMMFLLASLKTLTNFKSVSRSFAITVENLGIFSF
jgi:hypothetical protein